MMIQIAKDEASQSESGSSFRHLVLNNGKQSVEVTFIDSRHLGHQVWVCVQNGSHKAWKGVGRQFASIAAAIDSYKSAGVKSLLEAAAAA